MKQPFFGAMGCTASIVFTCLGASYGTAKSGVGIAAMGVLRPDLIVKSASPQGANPGSCWDKIIDTMRQTSFPSLWLVSSVSTVSSSRS